MEGCSINASFLITLYKRKDLVERNIQRIRNEYVILNEVPIVCVSSSAEDIGLKELEKYPNVHCIEFFDAPDNPQCTWFTKTPESIGFNGRHPSMLPPRIYCSIQEGLEKLTQLGIEKTLHLHADTYWDANKEHNLVYLFEELDKYYLMGDISIDEDNCGALPKGVHLHPEGLFFNIPKCNECGYSNFRGMYNSDFHSHNFSSPEALIGQYMIYCLSGKNITKPNDEIPNIYKDKVKIITSRRYHGVFPNGLVNVREPNH